MHMIMYFLPNAALNLTQQRPDQRIRWDLRGLSPLLFFLYFKPLMLQVLTTGMHTSHILTGFNMQGPPVCVCDLCLDTICLAYLYYHWTFILSLPIRSFLHVTPSLCMMALRSSLSSTWNVSHVSVFSIWLTEKSSSNIRRPKLQFSDTCCHLRLLNPKLSLLQSFTNSSTSRIPERLCMLSREVKPWPLTVHWFPGSAISYWTFSLTCLDLRSGLPLWNQHRMPLCFWECIQESQRVLTVSK